MKMKKILTEWRRFVVKESIEKSNFEAIIEKAWEESGQPYNEELAYVKASAHAARYMNGGETTKDEEYLNRLEFGKTSAERIQELNRNGTMFAEYFHVDEVYTPADDNRFLDTKEDNFKGVGVTPRWAKDNMDSSRVTGVLSKGSTVDEAYESFFMRFEQLDQMLDTGNYDFLNAFGAEMGRTNPTVKHSGGAASTGMLIVPSEATDAEQANMMEEYLFYMKNYRDENIEVVIEAERKLQSSIKAALSLWKKYGGFKDSDDEQVNKGAYLRMIKALSRSEATVKKLLKNPELYSPGSDLPQPIDEPVDKYELAMTTKDKEEANSIMRSLQKAGDKRWRDIRTRMRSM